MRWTFWLLVFSLTGCSVGPDYDSPPISIPTQWKNQQANTPTFLVDEKNQFLYREKWWEVFEDPQLNILENWAIQNNRDLFAAFQRVEQARAMVGIAAADFYPQITLNPQYTNTAELIKNYNLDSANLLGNAASIPRVFRVHELLYFLPINASYEVDLWGKIRDQYAAAKYQCLSERKDFDAMMLSLTSNLATAYYQLRLADSQIELLSQTLQEREKALKINQDRYEGEITFYADVTLAAQEYFAALVQLNEMARVRGVFEDQIAALIGMAASDFSLEPMPLASLPPCIPEGIPSEALLRRPDIAEAELNARSQHAWVKQAYSQFFPSLVLTGTLGFESPILRYFLTWFGRYWQVAGQIGQVLFDGGRLSSNLDLQAARFKEAGADYQQQVLTAFQEVEDALNNLNGYAQEYEAALETALWAKKSRELYQDRYTAGLTYYVDVVQTEIALLNYQMDVNTAQGYRYLATIQLIKALGGGWALPQDQSSPLCAED